jgi:hypothetical protein
MNPIIRRLIVIIRLLFTLCPPVCLYPPATETKTIRYSHGRNYNTITGNNGDGSARLFVFIPGKRHAHGILPETPDKEMAYIVL